MKKYSSIVKENYRHTLNKKRRFWFYITLIILISGLFLPQLISRVSDLVLYPFHVTTAWVKNSDHIFPTYLRSKSTLVNELESLRIKDATETGTQLSINRLLEENMQLRALTGVGTSSPRLVARVIARPNSLAYDFLQIDRGTNHGVVVGATVFSGIDTVLGVVTHVFPEYAFIELFTTAGFESTAYILGLNVFASIEGVGGGIARVKLPQGVSLSVGQLVLLPSISGGVYGEISWIENHPTQPEQYGYVVPPIAMNSIYYVSVDTEVLKPKTELEIENFINSEIQKQTIIDRSVIDYVMSKNALDNNATSSATTTENLESLD